MHESMEADSATGDLVTDTSRPVTPAMELVINSV